MSFKPEFTTTYTPGDLFYGFGLPRLALMKFLGVPTTESGLSALFMINNYLGTGDEIALLNDKTDVKVSEFAQTAKDTFIREQPGFADVKSLKFSDPRKKQFFAEAEKAFGIKQPEMEAAFKASLLKPHENFWDTLRKYNNGKYASALDFRRATAATDNVDSAENAAWRKKCKGGIYYGTHVLDKTVHFCLSLEVKTGDIVTGYKSMDFGAVVAKTSPSDTPRTTTKDEKIRLITPAELRWVYRHREDASVQRNIQFWTHTSADATKASWAPCGPPWDSDAGAKAMWAAYKRKTTNVHEGID